jgi:hypothetical protein
LGGECILHELIHEGVFFLVELLNEGVLFGYLGFQTAHYFTLGGLGSGERSLFAKNILKFLKPGQGGRAGDQSSVSKLERVFKLIVCLIDEEVWLQGCFWWGPWAWLWGGRWSWSWGGRRGGRWCGDWSRGSHLWGGVGFQDEGFCIRLFFSLAGQEGIERVFTVDVLDQ